MVATLLTRGGEKGRRKGDILLFAGSRQVVGDDSSWAFDGVGDFGEVVGDGVFGEQGFVAFGFEEDAGPGSLGAARSLTVPRLLRNGTLSLAWHEPQHQVLVRSPRPAGKPQVQSALHPGSPGPKLRR